jgi:hypothetical protein
MKKQLFTLIASAALLAGCGGNDESFVFTAPQPAEAQPSLTRQQVEFLARPAIGEGLLFSNALLNAYNSVSPSFVAAALADPNSAQGQAAAPIFAQAIAVLEILENVDGNPSNELTTPQIVGAFLPDVMRIDTTLNIAVADASYPTFNPAGSTLAGGRKITDDVIDITLTVLTDGAVTTDNVPYYRPDAGEGSTNPSIGHSLLNGQAAPNGPAEFPFLAAPY